MGWEEYKGGAKGVFVEGRKNTPPTRWWNHWWLALFGWKDLAILETADGLVHLLIIGYRPFKGQARLQMTAVTTSRVAVRIGHEDCTFFALDADDHSEIPLVYTRLVPLI